ncbi:MAG: hypothetical protein J7L38_00760 [Thermoproteales archaeon]|nr:hypothetical protein [Thermoproteales archaeon]
MAKIKLVFEKAGEVIVELTNKNPKTVEAILAATPFESKAMLWGDEVYFTTPARVGEENSQPTVNLGDVAYWPPGNAICLFFGPTPISGPNGIRPASPVNVIGKVVEGIDILRKVKDSEKVKVEKL